MVYTQHFCAKCNSEHIRRNGHKQGYARYQCKACGHQARFVPAAVARAVRYAQVDKLLEERASQRSIVRLTGVARATIASRIKKKP
jgi:transposase-like protein